MANQPQLIMVRPSLTDLPPLNLPDGYLLRHFHEGDEFGWNTLMDAAFERPPGHTDFSHSMAHDPVFLPERVKLIVSSQGEIVATASAWRDSTLGRHRGCLHWVGTHPHHAGKQLGSAVSIDAMLCARDEGLTEMALLTDDFRVGALKTYLRLGFEPRCTHKSHGKRWRRILYKLVWPEPFDAVIDGPLIELDT